MAKLLSVFINLTGFFFGTVIIFLIVYLFGWDLLPDYLVGNDIGVAQTAALWFDRFFPNIPQWFPLHGSGVQLSQGVIGAPIITVLTSRLFNITIVQSMHLWEFLSVYLTALGIFIFMRVRFKSWMAAILAGVFYPLSNASWAWLAEIGLYAHSLAFIFFPPVILFFDLLLAESFGQRRPRRIILWFFSSSLLASFAVLTHFLAGTVLFATIFSYGVIYSIFAGGKKIKNLSHGLALPILVIFVAVLLAGFWLFPYWRYTYIASRNLLAYWSFEQVPYTTLGALFGVSGLDSLSQNNSMWYVFFSRPVWALAILGAIFAFRPASFASTQNKQQEGQKNSQRSTVNKTAVAVSFVSIFFVFYAIAPGVTPWLVKSLLIFWRDIYVRGLVPVIILLPVLAAWGCLASGQWLAKFIPRVNLTPVFTLLIAILFIFFLKGGPPNIEQADCYQGFGRWWRTKVDYCNFWERLNKIDLSLGSWGAPYEGLARNIADKLELSEQTPIDISPKRGELIATWSNVSNAPILPLYWYAMALNWKFLGFQEGVFYDRESVEPPETIPQLASWFGIKYVILHKTTDKEIIAKNKTDPFEKYENKNWEQVLDEPDKSLEVVRSKNFPGVVTWTNRPTFLVIGNLKKQSYEQVFRKAVSGAIPYETALLVEGRDDGRLDRYTLEELKKFDGLILYGQVYDDKSKVEKMLTAYVEEGGRLFIESGWQYTNSEWQAHQALEVIPLQSLEWDSSEANNLKLDTAKIGGEFDQEKFGKFVYYNDTWDVATAPKSAVKDWGEVIYERNDKPIIVVGKLGQGKVVWSGMNLLGHLQYYQAREEYNFTQKLFSWLVEDKDNKDMMVTLKRPNPDKIEFTLADGSPSYSSLLWRENFYPDWQVNMGRKGSLPVYRSGPNLMLLRLPPSQPGEKIKLELSLSTVPLGARIISILTFIILLIFLLVPKAFVFFTGFSKGVFSRFSKTVLEEDEY
ncbi:hypothetical protein HY439_00200 [Candidatus Microgenomates bacterium]|nr:hypothetical protein [Candidatus Microgenomates bacterium]